MHVFESQGAVSVGHVGLGSFGAIGSFGPSAPRIKLLASEQPSLGVSFM